MNQYQLYMREFDKLTFLGNFSEIAFAESRLERHIARCRRHPSRMISYAVLE